MASNDGSTWIYIDNQNSIHTIGNSPASGGVNTARPVTNTYKYYRLLVFNGSGGFFEMDSMTFYGNVKV